MAMVCVVVALAISVAFSIVYENHKNRQQMQEELTAIATILGERSKAALQFGDDVLAQQNLSALKAIDEVETGCLYQQQNQLFVAYYRGDHKPFLCADSFDPNVPVESKDHIRVHYRIELDGSEIGTLLIHASMLNLRQLSLVYLAVNVGFAGIAAVIALLLASQLQRLITHPIQLLRYTAAQIEASHDYGIRAKRLSGDEVGELADAFNNMLGRIEADNQMLRESEQRFRTLTSASPFGVFQTDEKGSFIYVNDCWKEITGINKIIITAEDFAFALHPEDKVEVLNTIQEAWDWYQSYKTEFRLLQENGNEVSVICQAKPILGGNGELIGYLGSLADVSELKSMQMQLEKLALYDPLTQLANRRLFRNRLEKTIRSTRRANGKFALMFLDFDHFKKINDTLGHDQGDELLVVMAKRLRQSMRPGDTVARLGGDEFTVLIPEIKNLQEVDLIARKILMALRKPIVLAGHEVIATCSIGVTVFPDDAETANALMKNADMAMYHSKDGGRDNFRYFSEEMNYAIHKQIQLENDLRQAVKKQEFELYYQPKVSLKSNQVVGYEALIRWHHPKRGLIAPAEFIPVAEDVGLITGLGRWVMHEVCEQIKVFMVDDKLPEQGCVAINLSAKQFHDPKLVEDIRSILAANEVEPCFLELEITESLLMNDVDDAIETLKALRDMGVRVSIDDFGTGYSSFNYLRRLPIDCIKVDRSFVMDIPRERDDMEIVSAMIAMAHKLGLEVVAEGVETEEQKEFLQMNQCDMVQGYLLGRPVPAHHLSKLDVFDAQHQQLN
ncbi:MAG: EAL domain-containing protein [Pseudomonadales bacterium]|nr:EAL domain-containing protein [Pseudomonadales bacterium]